ncbi:MAG TPA: type II toxin-antitoxin system RatA family toxin [Xanthobacteraceae bacterium]|nr:type II toxin-antitoxin system RatA family toxin [Xanthobacteraceae bacterium]
MPSFRTTRRVKHAAADMFELVADIERYPEFVPLCERLTVKRRAEGGEGTQILVADMTVAYGPMRYTFTSQVTLDRPRLAILVEYLDGPFRQLENRWRFKPEDETACTVEFFICYEFRSRTLGHLMGAVFDKAFRRFAEAFETRADKLYGLRAR